MKGYRRKFLIALGSSLVLTAAHAQVQPTYLRLVRRTGWEQLMGRNKCSIGDLYKSIRTFPISDPGTKICNVLELAYRNNASQISSVPAGEYTGFVRTDGARGWRIELRGTAPRENIQMHVGNRPSDSIGCLLPGTGDSNDAACQIAGSVDAFTVLKATVGSAANAQIVLLIQ